MLMWILSQAAQATIEMADALRADGKIYVVVAVVAIMVLLMVLYLIRLDKKIGHLENELKNKQHKS
jgi:tRNA(Phe) wybutosine-synthesizing methylase Tyw3